MNEQGSEHKEKESEHKEKGPNKTKGGKQTKGMTKKVNKEMIQVFVSPFVCVCVCWYVCVCVCVRARTIFSESSSISNS